MDAGEEEADEGDAAEGEERVVPQRREKRHLERAFARENVKSLRQHRLPPTSPLRHAYL